MTRLTPMHRYAGTLHGFNYTFPRIAVAVKLDRDARDGLRWLGRDTERFRSFGRVLDVLVAVAAATKRGEPARHGPY